MAGIEDVNQGIQNAITSWFTKGAILNVLGWVFAAILVIGFCVYAYWWWTTKKQFNKLIYINEIIGNYYQRTGKDTAKTVKIGTGGFEILFLRKGKSWKLAHGGRTGRREYNFFIQPDGYWYNGMFSAVINYIDQLKGLIPVVTTNPTMRSQYTALEKQIESLHGEKQKFWDKYGIWVMTGVFILINGIFLWLSYRELGAFLGQGTELANRLTELANSMSNLAVNMRAVQ
jgi:hypothetical protein